LKAVTIKHDGMCSKLVRDNAGVTMFRRYDVRKGQTPPPNSVPAGVASSGAVEFFWVDITDSNDPSDQYYNAAVKKDKDKIFQVSMVVPTPRGFQAVWTPVSAIATGTFELVGPKIQSNRYQFSSDEKVQVNVVHKNEVKQALAPRHYFIQHGAFDITNVFTTKVSKVDKESLTEFILQNSIEGLVVHFSNSLSFKCNRGHIGHELNNDDVLRITL